MKPRLSILTSMCLSLLCLLFVMGELQAQAGILSGDNQVQLASNRSGSLWIEVTPDHMYTGDCNGKLSYGGGVGAYRLLVHDNIKLTQVPGQYLYSFCATVGGDYAFQVWDGSGNTVSARVNVSQRSNPPPPRADILGSVWRVTEGDPNWTGTWTRRGTSSVFDAVWTGYGQRSTGALTMAVSGNSVTITRGNGQYTGTINGKSASGTASWYSSGQRWSASIE